MRILLRSHGLSIPSKGTTPEIAHSGSLRLMSRRPGPARCSHGILHLGSLTSVLIRAVLHTSLESPLAGHTREHASCAHRDTTLCASRESSVHRCLSLKAVLSSRLRDSTTAWSVEASNTTSVVVVRGKTSRVPSVFLSCTAAQASARMHLKSACRFSSERSCERLTCDDHRLLLNASRLLRLFCRGLQVLPARRSLHALSSQACRLLEVRTIMFWTLRFCIPLLLSWDFGVRPVHAYGQRPSCTSGTDSQGLT